MIVNPPTIFLMIEVIIFLILRIGAIKPLSGVNSIDVIDLIADLIKALISLYTRSTKKHYSK